MNDIDKQSREDAKAEHQKFDSAVAQMNESAVLFASATVKALLLLNGAAAIAMLGFVASLASSEASIALDLAIAVKTLQLFALGAGLAVLSTGFAYATMFLQAAHSQSMRHLWEYPYVVKGPNTRSLLIITVVIQLAAIALAFASLVAFACGVLHTSGMVLT